MDNDDSEVIIIGAGPSGIGAALTLQRAKVPFIVLQARQRLGGRVYSEEVDGVELDFGACWVHSCSHKNPVLKEVERLKWKKGQLSGQFFGRKMLDGEVGNQFDDYTSEIAYFYFKQFFDNVEKQTQKIENDCSMYESVKHYYDQNIEKLNPQEKRLVTLLINMTEHYEASSIKELSALHYDETTDSGGDYFPSKSYGSLMKKIGEQIQHRVTFNTVVQEIIYGEKVEVRCSNGKIYKGSKVIAGIPLGLLKAQTIKFTPQLPQLYQKAIKYLGNGLMNKVLISFTENFWGNSAWLSIGCDERGKFPHFYNFSQKERHLLCCFITDDFARKIQHFTDEQILQDLINLLKNIYKDKNIQVRDYKITRWGQDKFSLGSYAAFHTNSSPEDCFTLRKPINDTLWLVGEHCYAEHIGTSHGAFQTGIWASEDVMKKMKWLNPELKKK